MLKVIESSAKYSQISAIGEQVRKAEKESGLPYLYLNQGVNAVVPINLEPIIPLIDFNAKDIQVYAPMKGRSLLKDAINATYFQSQVQVENILITNGGMSGLDLVFQSVAVDKFYLPSYFWGSYAHILNHRQKPFSFYDNFNELKENTHALKGSAVVICDPNNPLGNKFVDEDLIELIVHLNRHEIAVLIDSPYRRVFIEEDTFYNKIAALENVIIIESFSKSIGLSGQRIGFIHSNNKDLMSELGLRLMYSSNGVNAFAQVLVEKLLTTAQGKQTIAEFKQKTTEDIKQNIDYLRNRKFLSEEFYQNSEPLGIFVVINKSFTFLMNYRIASVSLSFFTHLHHEMAKEHSRICVSVPHELFKSFFDSIP